MKSDSEHLNVRKSLYLTDPYQKFPLEGAQLDLQGWHSTDPIFARLIGDVRPRRIIEVGTWKGASAIGMARLAKDHGLDVEIVCIDTWLGALEFWMSHDDPNRYGSLKMRHGYPNVYYTFIANVILSGHSDSITPFPQTSLNGARWLSLQGLHADLIYIDGSHEEADVLADVVAFWQVLRPGGVIFGDDFSESWPSVIRAVRSFAEHNGLRLEEDNEFWIIKKLEDSSVKPTARLASPIRAENPLLLVHATESSRSVLVPFVENLGYRFVEPDEIGTAPLNASALWIPPSRQMAEHLPACALSGEVQSLFWLEQPASVQGSPDWCLQWIQRLEQCGGTDRIIALHPYQPLRTQRHRCELLARRLGVDLTSLRLGDALTPQVSAPLRPQPENGCLAAQLDILRRLGIAPQEFFNFPSSHRIELHPPDIHLDNPGGGVFESYTASCFLLHPPKPEHGWMRLYIRDLDWATHRFFTASLSLPSDRAPAVRFQWSIITTDGRHLQRSEVVLKAGEFRNWVVMLPDQVPANCIAVLATRVESVSTNDFAWSTWRDPFLFS